MLCSDWLISDHVPPPGANPGVSPAQITGIAGKGLRKLRGAAARGRGVSAGPRGDVVVVDYLRSACLFSKKYGESPGKTKRSTQIQSSRPWEVPCWALSPRCRCPAPSLPCSDARWRDSGKRAKHFSFCQVWLWPSGRATLFESQQTAQATLWGRGSLRGGWAWRAPPVRRLARCRSKCHPHVCAAPGTRCTRGLPRGAGRAKKIRPPSNRRAGRWSE